MKPPESNNKGSRIMGLEVCTIEDDAEDQESWKAKFLEALPELLQKGKIFRAPANEDLSPEKPVWRTKSGWQLDPQKCAPRRRREFEAIERQEALLEIPMAAVPK